MQPQSISFTFLYIFLLMSYSINESCSGVCRSSHYNHQNRPSRGVCGLPTVNSKNLKKFNEYRYQTLKLSEKSVLFQKNVSMQDTFYFCYQMIKESAINLSYSLLQDKLIDEVNENYHRKTSDKHIQLLYFSWSYTGTKPK